MRIVVFDFDGTLVDSNTIKKNMFYKFSSFDKGGTEIMKHMLETVAGNRYTIWDAYLRERDGTSYDASIVPSIVEEFNLAVNKAVAQASEMPGAIQLLDKLEKSGIRLIVSSATPLKDLKSILEQRRWIDRFNLIFGSPSTKYETLNFLSNAYGITANEIAVVGDGKDDRESAGMFGCKFYPVGEARGIRKKEKIYNLFELQNILTDTL